MTIFFIKKVYLKDTFRFKNFMIFELSKKLSIIFYKFQNNNFRKTWWVLRTEEFPP